MYLNDFKFRKMMFYSLEEKIQVTDHIIDKSDILISIFMPNLQTATKDHKGVRSLNLSVACGIAIYEAHKQINFQNDN